MTLCRLEFNKKSINYEIICEGNSYAVTFKTQEMSDF